MMVVDWFSSGIINSTLRLFVSCWDTGKIALVKVGASALQEIAVVADFPSYCLSCARNATRLAATNGTTSLFTAFSTTSPDVYAELSLGGFSGDPASISMVGMSASGDRMAGMTNGDRSVALFDFVAGDYALSSTQSLVPPDINARNMTPGYLDDGTPVVAVYTLEPKSYFWVNGTEIDVSRALDLGGLSCPGDGTELVIHPIGEDSVGGHLVLDAGVVSEVNYGAAGNREMSGSCCAYDASYFAAANDVLKVYKRGAGGVVSEIFSESLPGTVAALVCDPTMSTIVAALAHSAGGDPLRVYRRTDDDVVLAYTASTASCPVGGSLAGAAMGDLAWVP